MTLRRDRVSKMFSGDIRDRTAGRVHVSLKTKVKAEAVERYAAVCALVREGDATLLAELRGRRLNVEAVARCYRDRRPFGELRATRTWPALGAARDGYLGWLEDHPQRSANTAHSARYDLASAVDFFGERTPLESLRADDVGRYRRSLEESGLAAGTVRLKLTRLAALYAWVQRDETRSARADRREAARLYSPVDPEAMPAKSGGRARFLSTDETTRFVAATPDAFQLLIGFGLLMGLRIDEARVLRPPPHDIDREVGLVLIQPKELRAGVTWRPKTKSSVRELPIPDALLPILEVHLRRYANDRWVFPAPSGAGRSGGGGVPMSEDLVQRTLRRIAGDAGLVGGREDPMGVTFHTLRHTFASNLVMAGVDLFTVARLLGHAKTDEIEQVYGHLAPEHRQAALRRLGDRLAPAYRPRLVAERPA